MAAIIKTAKKEAWRDKFNAQIAAVVSNKANATGLGLAKSEGISTAVLDNLNFATREAFDAQLMQTIDAFDPHLIVLAGFMRILTPSFVNHYAGRLINIHPSLLPAFTGLNTHQRAIDAGCQFAGATVHHVTSQLDVGPILAQVVVPILHTDTASSLAAKVLSQEHLMYPAVIAKLISTT